MTDIDHKHLTPDQQKIERLRRAISKCSIESSKLNTTLLNINENIKEERNLIAAARRQLIRIKSLKTKP